VTNNDRTKEADRHNKGTFDIEMRAWALVKIKNCNKPARDVCTPWGYVSCGQISKHSHCIQRCSICRFLISELKITEEEIG